MIGTPQTQLVVLRGNSGSGKTTVARALQRRRGRNQLAVVGHDVIRRDVLWADDDPGNPAIELIDLMARYALESGFSVIVEGILHPHLRSWWMGAAYVDGLDETTIGSDETLDGTIERIESDCGWG